MAGVGCDPAAATVRQTEQAVAGDQWMFDQIALQKVGGCQSVCVRRAAVEGVGRSREVKRSRDADAGVEVGCHDDTNPA